MPIPTTQDFVKGIDFTALNPQTAAEHNQLIELAQPYSVTDDTGIGLLLVTSDTALGVADIPDPTVAGYTKWERYGWVRRLHPTAPIKTAMLYVWCSATTTDYSGAGFNKWMLIDPAAYTSIDGGAGTPLQAAIDAIAGDTATALNAAIAASADVAAIQTQIGTVTGDDLQTQITANTGNVAINTASVTSIEEAIAGVNATTGLPQDLILGTGGVNGQIIALQAAMTALQTTQRNPSDVLIQSTIPYSIVRTNANASATEWFDPTNNTSGYIRAVAAAGQTFAVNSASVVVTGLTGLVPQGSYLIVASISGVALKGSTSNTNIPASLKVVVGAQTFAGNIAYTQYQTGSSACAKTLVVFDVVTVSAANVSGGSVTLSANVTTGDESFVSGGCTVVLKRL
jgi:hypothetical protein